MKRSHIKQPLNTRLLSMPPPVHLKQWIRVIDSEISSACLHSGFVTSFFEISHGAHQGDPLSSLLYTLVAEVLGAAIRNCKDIRGVAYLAHLRNLRLANMWMMEI